jgi:ribonucleoside-triphosphate reductase
MHQYRFTTKSTSLLPYVGNEFKQAPKEPIDTKTYEKKVMQIHGDVQRVFNQLNDNHDQKGAEIIGQTDCEGGACPIK